MTVTPGPTMAQTRFGCQATALSGGTILVTGGASGTFSTAQAHDTSEVVAFA